MFRKLLYQIRNWKAHLRTATEGTETNVPGGRIVLQGELTAKVIRSSGKVEELGVVSRRVVTTTGVNFMRDDFNGGTTDITTLNYHDSGTGTNAESVSDTDLQTPAGPTTRTAGIQTAPATKQYRTTATITYSGPLAITEHGIFNQSARGAGTVLWDRSVFAVINVGSGDAIQFQYTLTINDGG